jgi:RHS repeat-associated protein
VAKPGVYNYDANGNMTYAPSKNGTVKYNYLNLPERVTLGSKGNIYYHYNAAGTKLAKYVENSTSSTNTTTEYIGNRVYTNGQLSFFSTEEGRAIPIKDGANTRWHFEYNLKDHLGNTRVTFGGSNIPGATDIVQTSNYYPFGLVMNQNNYNTGGNSYQQNKYLYNGKELQTNEFEGGGLDWYDYGARFYDPAIGRWHCIDPMAEKYASLSTYDYVGGNPINRYDPNGMDWYMTETDSSYQYMWVDSQNETYKKDGATYQNVGSTFSINYGGRYFHYYQNYQVASSAGAINVRDFVLGNQNITNQLINKLDDKYATQLFAQAVNHAINTDGTATALTTLAVPASIIGAIEAAPFLLRNSKYLKNFIDLKGGGVEYFNQLIKSGFNPAEAAKNFNFTSLLGGKYGQYGGIASSMLVQDASIQNGVVMHNLDAGIVSRGVAASFGAYTGSQFGKMDKNFGTTYSIVLGILMGNINVGE